MNILFFLTPKKDVCYIYSSDTVAQAIDKILSKGFTTIPVLDEGTGRYEGSLSAIDLLQALTKRPDRPVETAAETLVRVLPRRRSYSPVSASCEIEDLLSTAQNQNFVPVTDDTGAFIGIITRRELLRFLERK